MGVDGWCGEHLSLVAPLSLGKRPAPQWLRGLEAALSYSLGSSLAECHSSLPESLAGAGNTEQQGYKRTDISYAVYIHGSSGLA
jgi:hypothetical protein